MILFGNFSSPIRLTCPYQINCFLSIFSIIEPSILILVLTSSFLILSNHDIPAARFNTSISVASNFLFMFSVILHLSDPYSRLLFIIVSYICIFLLLSISLLHRIPFRHLIIFLVCTFWALISASSRYLTH